MKTFNDLENISKNTHSLIIILVVFIITFGIWSAISPLDVVSAAKGTVIPVGKIKQVQHLEGGIIQSINVKEGQKVNVGDTLVVLSSIINRSELEELKVRILSLKADIIRLQSESKNEKTLIFSKNLGNNKELIKRTNELFNARIQTIKSKKLTQEKTIDEIKARLRNLKDKLLLAKEQVKIGDELIKQKLSNRYEQIERLKEYNSLKSKIDEDTIAITRAEEQLNNIDREYKEKIQAELSQSKQNLQEFNKRLERFKDSLNRTVLKAPLSGTIKKLNMVTIGGVLKPGETVMEIVPNEDKLIVEAKLLPQDVGHIQVGQKAFVQLDGSDSYKYGKIQGIVTLISADSLVTKEGEAFFIVRVALNKDHFGDNQKQQIKLFPGMLVNVGIILGERTVLEYILSPFLGSQSFVLTEK